jgi:hypothetical protein
MRWWRDTGQPLAAALVAWHERSYEHSARPPHEWLPEH